jgi:hypothetical protein
MLVTNWQAREAKRSKSYIASTERNYKTANADFLTGMLSYFKYLYIEGEISGRAYEVLVSQAIAIFVGNTVSFEIERILDEIGTTLRKAD